MAEETIQKKSGAERQAAFLISALEKASQNDGVLLNGTMKQAPRFYDKGLRVNPVNALVMAIHSDQAGYKTNSYVMFNDTKNRGEAIRKGETGVPFVWTNNSEYINKENPEDKISRAEYKQLPESDQARYKTNPREDVYVLFNIDQTTMPSVHREDYDKHVAQFGGMDGGLQETYLDKNDKAKRMSVNQFILNMRDNLVPIRKDATGIAHYDGKRDTIYIPAQKNFPNYGDYVQEVARQVAHATGITGRLNRDRGTMQKEAIVEELASAVKMLDFGMTARLRPETMKELPAIIERMKENPQYAKEVMRDVNRTVGMIKKAESGEKIQIIESPSEKRQQEWAAQFPIEQVPEKFNAVVMLKDDEGKWALAAKTESQPVFAVHPSKEDVSLYFDVIKNDHDGAHVQEFRTQMAQKYYSMLSKGEAQPINLFKSQASQEALDLISKVNAFKTKDSKMLLVATIGGEKQRPVYVSQDQWQRLWLADDKQDYKTHLAATLYSDVLTGKLEAMKQATSPKVDGTPLHEEQEQRDSRQQVAQTENEKKQEEGRRNSPEQKEKERQEEKAKEEATKEETIAVAAVALSPVMKQFMDLKSKHPDALLLFRVGDFYETYQQDARRASEVLGITLTRSNSYKGPDGKAAEMAGFPHHALDTYLPKLVRAGERVAICDQLEAPRATTQHGSGEHKEEGQQAVKEMVIPAQKQEEQQPRGMHR